MGDAERTAKLEFVFTSGTVEWARGNLSAGQGALTREYLVYFKERKYGGKRPAQTALLPCEYRFLDSTGCRETVEKGFEILGEEHEHRRLKGGQLGKPGVLDKLATFRF